MGGCWELLDPVRRLAVVALSITVAAVADPIVPPDDSRPGGAIVLAPASPSLIVEAWSIVRKSFMDDDFGGVDWMGALGRHRADFDKAEGPDEQSTCINAMLAELKTSHTGHFTPRQVEYYELLDIFSMYGRGLPQAGAADAIPPANGQLEDLAALERPLQFQRGRQRPEVYPSRTIEYVGIGIRTAILDGHTFIAGVLEGQAAAQAGLLVGDELVSADDQPFQPVRSFEGKAGRAVTLTVRRSPDTTMQVAVTPRRIRPQSVFVDACRNSSTIFQRDGKALGYMHAWSLAGSDTPAAISELLFDGALREIDGLVFDLRDGWGGSADDMLDLFLGGRPVMSWRNRERQLSTLHQSWNGPLVVLINGGSRSAKEIVAWGLKKQDRATLVGTRTAGAVVGGSPFLLSDDSLLIVATVNLEVDGQRLEGRGVEPDIEVERPIPYAAGADPQLEAALNALAEKIAVVGARTHHGDTEK